jgi:hypothetical protein
VIVLKYGSPLTAAFKEEGGDQGPVSRLIERRSDDELAALMTNLAVRAYLPDMERSRMPSLTLCFEAGEGRCLAYADSALAASAPRDRRDE